MPKRNVRENTESLLRPAREKFPCKGWAIEGKISIGTEHSAPRKCKGIVVNLLTISSADNPMALIY